MAFSYTNPVGDGTTTLFNVPFPYISTADITVKVNGTITSFSWQNASTVIVSPAPANGLVLEIRRTTQKANLNVVFQDGSVLGKTDLNNENTQLLYIAQEAFDANASAMNLNALSKFDALNKQIQNVADPLLAQDAVTKSYVDSKTVVAGNVPSPGASVGTPSYWLKATGAAAWAWARSVCADISDATAFGISMLKAADAAAARTLLVIGSGLLAMTGAAINEASAVITSAATTNIGAAAGNYIQVNGTTTISAFDVVQSGTERTLQFTGSLVLTHNATSLILPGARNITTAAGDVVKFRSEGAGNWRCVGFMRGSVSAGAGVQAFASCNSSGVLLSGFNATVTRTGTGQFTVSFVNAMPDVNYSAVACSQGGGATVANTNTLATGSINVTTFTSNTAVLIDEPFSLVVCR